MGDPTDALLRLLRKCKSAQLLNARESLRLVTCGRSTTDHSPRAVAAGSLARGVPWRAGGPTVSQLMDPYTAQELVGMIDEELWTR